LRFALLKFVAIRLLSDQVACGSTVALCQLALPGWKIRDEHTCASLVTHESIAAARTYADGQSAHGAIMPNPDPSSQEVLLLVCAAAVAAAVTAATATAVLALAAEEQSRHNYPAKRRRIDKEFDADEWMNTHTDAEIRGFFRMNRASFDTLHTRLSHHLQPSNPAHGVRGGGRAISSEQRLMAALRYFGGGQVWDIAEIFQMSRSQVRKSVRMVICAVNVEFEDDWAFPWIPPSSNPTAEEVERVRARLRALEIDHQGLAMGFCWRGQVCTPSVHFLASAFDRSVPLLA